MNEGVSVYYKNATSYCVIVSDKASMHTVPQYSRYYLKFIFSTLIVV
jgi:hypothetical protein